jgi:chaperone required for assembly of F1-ATPase
MSARRFYKKVDVAAQDENFLIHLDGRVLKTPGKLSLVMDTRMRAQAVAGEWDAQKDEIIPQTMPCTRLMNVACELTPQNRPKMVDEFVSYTGNDLLCFRVDDPRDLAEIQAQKWQPVLDWVNSSHGVTLVTTNGIHTQSQPVSSLDKVREIAQKLSDTDLTLLLHFTACYGSAILALAVREKHLTVAHAFDLSRLEETYQNKTWGEDELAVQRTEDLARELEALKPLI